MKKLTFSIIASAIMLSSTSFAQEIPGEIVIDAKDDISESDYNDIRTQLRASFPNVSFENTDLFDDTKISIAHVDDSVKQSVIALLAGNSNIQHVEPNYLLHATSFNMAKPNDPLYDKQWHMQFEGVEKAWGYSTGRGAVVAVIDTGVDCELEDMANTICVGGWNFVGNNDNATDDQSHGSHVAGTIAQVTNNGIGGVGMAGNSKIMPVKVLSASGSGSSTDVSDGIRWAADNGANVINLSLGGGPRSAIMAESVMYAKNKGVFVAAANGNDSGKVNYPAAYEGAFAVSAMDINGKIAGFSSRGPETFISAPGVNVTQQTICGTSRGSDCPAYLTFNGTSMATPHVAGAAALLVSMGVSDPDAIARRLASSADKNGTTKNSPNEYGNGLLKADEAVSSEHNRQAMWRLMATFLIGSVMLWRTKVVRTKLFTLSGVMTGVGLFFIPWLVGYPNIVVSAFTRPLVELTSLYSVNLTNFLPLCNALFLGLMMLCTWQSKTGRMIVAGAGVGMAGYTASQIVLGTLFIPLGSFTIPVLVVNALLCLFVSNFNLKHLNDPTPDANQPI